MAAKPKTFDECLAAVSADQRAALEKIRVVIKATAPLAEEGVCYGLAAFRLDGKPLAGLGASVSHLAFYPMSGSIVAAHKDALKKYDTSKGTIRFSAEKPLPATLIRKLVKARMAEIAGPKQSAYSTRKARLKASAAETQTDPAVIAYLRELDHPRKKEIDTVRQIILGVSPVIREGIKWNSPSFRTTDDFATFTLRQGRVWLILHTGAKVKATAVTGVTIADPTGLLKWLAKDRALVTFDNGKDVAAKRTALKAIIGQWIQLL